MMHKVQAVPPHWLHNDAIIADSFMAVIASSTTLYGRHFADQRPQQLQSGCTHGQS